MKIFLVQEDIDMGYHTHAAWADKPSADADCKAKNDQYQIDFPRQERTPFWVEEMELQGKVAK